MLKLKLLASAVGLMAIAPTVVATPVMLDSTEMSFIASGNPNTIGGNWTADFLDVPQGGRLEFFTVRVLDINSSFGAPESISFNSRIPFYGNTQLSLCIGPCVQGPEVDSVGRYNVVPYDTYTDIGFLQNLIERQDPLPEGYPPLTDWRPVTVAYRTGGSYADISGRLMIEAWGQAPASSVPEPSSALLLMLGIGGIALIGRRKTNKNSL